MSGLSDKPLDDERGIAAPGQGEAKLQPRTAGVAFILARLGRQVDRQAPRGGLALREEWFPQTLDLELFPGQTFVGQESGCGRRPSRCSGPTASAMPLAMATSSPAIEAVVIAQIAGRGRWAEPKLEWD